LVISPVAHQRQSTQHHSLVFTTRARSDAPHPPNRNPPAAQSRPVNIGSPRCNTPPTLPLRLHSACRRESSRPPSPGLLAIASARPSMSRVKRSTHIDETSWTEGWTYRRRLAHCVGARAKVAATRHPLLRLTPHAAMATGAFTMLPTGPWVVGRTSGATVCLGRCVTLSKSGPFVMIMRRVTGSFVAEPSVASS